MASVLEFEPRRITVEEYHRMVDAGVFDEDERIELLDGILVPMSPQSPDHADLVQWLNNRLVRLVGPQYDVRPQLPLTAGKRSEPEPDLAVVPAGRSRRSHPETALLVIEVARDSLRKDRLLKTGLYASPSGCATGWAWPAAVRRAGGSPFRAGPWLRSLMTWCGRCWRKRVGKAGLRPG